MYTAIMKFRRARILIIDDSVVARRTVSHVIASNPLLELAGTAPNGSIALQKIPSLSPDLILLDVETPEMKGLEVLEQLRREHPEIPVLVLSSHTAPDAETTVRALSLGAADFACKPSGGSSLAAGLEGLEDRLVAKIRALVASLDASQERVEMGRLPAPSSRTGESCRRVPPETIAVGVSTGGPLALLRLLGSLPSSFPVPFLVAQHMLPSFTRLLAARLSEETELEVREAEEGDTLRPGLVLVAPGDFHMILRRSPVGLTVGLHQGKRRNYCRPSVDVLFDSVAEVCGSRAVGVVLTGMGRDGLLGARRLMDRGAFLIAQDRATSVVWGMPGAVVRERLADVVLPIQEIGSELERLANASDVGRNVTTDV